MLDIYLGLAVSLTISVVAFLVAYHFGRLTSLRLGNLLTTALVLLLLLYIRDLWNNQAVASFLPYSI